MRRAKPKKTISGYTLSDEALLLYQYLCRYRLTQYTGSPTFSEMTAFFLTRGRAIGRSKLTDCLDELQAAGLIDHPQGQHRSIAIRQFELDLLRSQVSVGADGAQAAPVDKDDIPGYKPDELIQDLLAQYLKHNKISGVLTIEGRLMHLSEPQWVPVVN